MDAQPFAETQQFFVKQRCAPLTRCGLLARHHASAATPSCAHHRPEGAGKPGSVSSSFVCATTKSPMLPALAEAWLLPGSPVAAACQKDCSPRRGARRRVR